ncbi:MAG TPA: hypothetical protein VGM30_06955 [Puia sp.]|jgi:hypothetical protein
MRQFSDPVPSVPSRKKAFYIAFGLLLLLTGIYATGVAAMMAGIPINALELPISLIFSGTVFYVSTRQELSPAAQRTVAGTVILLAILSGILAWWVLDTSWDGQWYHQVAIEKMREGWNPIRNPFYTLNRYDTSSVFQNKFKSANYVWIQHYPKFSWITSAVICKCTGWIETGKSINQLIAWAVFSYGYYLLRPFTKGRVWTILVCALLALNPVVTTQLFSDYVDGNVAALLTLILLILVSLELQYDEFRKAKWVALGCCIIMVSNLKFTGLVFSGLLLFVFFLYWIFRRRPLSGLIKKAGVFLLFYILAFFVFGYNPYLTNYRAKGDFFYPTHNPDAYAVIISSKPIVLRGKNTAENLAISLLSESSNDSTIDHPLWKNPFIVHRREVSLFSTTDVRIAGFGPLFQLAVWLSLILLCCTIALFRKNSYTPLQLTLFLCILASVLAFPESWWARYCPQLFIFPFVVMFPVLANQDIRANRTLRYLSGLILVTLLVNLAVIGSYNFAANVFKTRLIRQEMTALKQTPVPIKINFNSSGFQNVRRRLQEAKVPFIESDTLTGEIKRLHTRYEFSPYDPTYIIPVAQ